MAHLHFTAAEPYRQRVIQLGEDPNSVWNVGGFGVDAALNASLISKNSLESLLGISISEPTLLITFHPETGPSCGSADSQMVELLAALEQIDAQLIFTMPNADAGGRVIFKLINKFVAAYRERACAHVSLGQTAYLSALALSAGVVGNSSSGLIEAPAYGVGTVNIGNRQSGRLKASSVIDCVPERNEIKRAIATLLSPDTQQRNRSGINNPYGAGGAARRTVEIIEEWEPKLTNKTFFDLDKVSSDLGRVCA
jgi:GDP/UDP-N,N'-diacetylbacillosamine 2-epimerase (hydrolysing)